MAKRIYFCVYSFLKRTPSRDMGHEMSAIVMALMVTMHLQALVMIPPMLMGNPLPLNAAKFFFGACMVLFSVGSLYYFIWRKRGAEIVKSCEGIMSERLAVLTGCGLFFETLLLPVLIGLVVIMFS